MNTDILAGNAARQSLLVAVGLVVFCCVKRNMSEKEALLRQRSEIFEAVAVTQSSALQPFLLRCTLKDVLTNSCTLFT